MADSGHQARLRHFESRRQQAAVDRNRRIPKRTLQLRAGRMSLMSRIWLRMRRPAVDLCGDTRGIAAVEFALVVPLMLVLFFGTVEFSSCVAVDRKVTLMARTLSDLTSQNVSVTSTQLTNIFNASTGILTPYSASPMNARIVELYVDPNLVVRQ